MPPRTRQPLPRRQWRITSERGCPRSRSGAVPMERESSGRRPPASLPLMSREISRVPSGLLPPAEHRGLRHSSPPTPFTPHCKNSGARRGRTASTCTGSTPPEAGSPSMSTFPLIRTSRRRWIARLLTGRFLKPHETPSGHVFLPSSGKCVPAFTMSRKGGE